MLRLVLFCKSSLNRNPATFLYSQPLSQTTLASLSIHCPQQTHTTTMTANITQRHHVTTTHGEEMGGTERTRLCLKRLFSHCCYFYLTPFRCFHNPVHVTIIRAQQGELRLTEKGVWMDFFVVVFLCRESCLRVPFREPDGRA